MEFCVEVKKVVPEKNNPDDTKTISYVSEVFQINNKVRPTEFLCYDGKNFIWESMNDCIPVELE